VDGAQAFGPEPVMSTSKNGEMDAQRAQKHSQQDRSDANLALSSHPTTDNAHLRRPSLIHNAQKGLLHKAFDILFSKSCMWSRPNTNVMYWNERALKL
jgi:hypothetical protein